MSDYTPTTEEVRAVWRDAMTETSEYFDALSPAEADKRFNAWLQAHDREVVAKALREARDDLSAMVDDDLTVIVGDPDDDDAWVPVRVDDWLDIRADRICAEREDAGEGDRDG